MDIKYIEKILTEELEKVPLAKAKIPNDVIDIVNLISNSVKWVDDKITDIGNVDYYKLCRDKFDMTINDSRLMMVIEDDPVENTLDLLVAYHWPCNKNYFSVPVYHIQRLKTLSDVFIATLIKDLHLSVSVRLCFPIQWIVCMSITTPLPKF